MKKKVRVTTAIALVLLAILTTFNVTYVTIWNSFNDRLTNLNAREAAFEKMSELAAYVDEYYIGDYSEDTLIENAAKAYIKALPDDSSYYLTDGEQSLLDNEYRTKYVGIGIIAHYDTDAKGIRIYGFHTGSKAKQAGLQVLDIITAVEGEPVSSTGYEMAMEAIRGNEGSSVEVTILRESTGRKFNINVTRGAVNTKPSISSKLFSSGIAYVRITSFDTGMDEEFEQIISQLEDEGARAYIFDVRLNPGGYMDVMGTMLDMLMPEGVMYQSMDSHDEITMYNSDADYIDAPFAVLVDKYTVGAAEYFAADLSENGALIIGEDTAGEGLAQQRVSLSDGSTLVLSTIEYLTPSGRSLDDFGLPADLTVSVGDDELVLIDTNDYNYYTDSQLTTAIRKLAGEMESD